ncbi:MAG TPA: radical SAM protein, partial [Spirochaetota bacterium]|nr:radical SAM protein [Spirochaetota bacterium]
EIMKIFQKNNINIIRIGINPVENGNVSKIIGGAYHPSFGQIVKSRLKRDDMEKLFLFQDIEPKSTILIPSDYKEEYIGQKRANIKYLEDKYRTRIFYKFYNGELIKIK